MAFRYLLMVVTVAVAHPTLLRASPVTLSYQKNRLVAVSADGAYRLTLQSRLQFRYAYPLDVDPRSAADLTQRRSSFMIRRARFKLEGHAYKPWMKWRLQYDWAQPVLRDFSFTVDKFEALQVVVGRRKVFWNDERVTSSGRQQFINRSIVNDLFTVDRQQGLQMQGRLFARTLADLSYHAGVFTGVGVGSRDNDDQHMMVSAMLRWNLGGEMDFSQSDVEYHEHPLAAVSSGIAHAIGRCTAFETDARSCRALPTARRDGTSFDDPSAAAAGQFELEQLFVEARLKWRGVYLKHEHHWKNINDRSRARDDLGKRTRMLGYLSQLGYFPHHAWAFVPPKLELAVRHANVDPARGRPGDLQREWSAVSNWFFDGHASKLSAEYSHLFVADPVAASRGAEHRVRVQWDVSF